MKLSIITLSIFSLFAFSACKKEVTEVQQVKQAYSAVYTIHPGAWQLSNNSTVASVTLQVPEIDNYMYTNGAVLAYIAFDGTNYDALPETFDNYSYVVTHNVGSVTISIYDQLGGQISPPNTDLKTKIVLIDADPLD